MRVHVTGATGFVGSHLLPALVERGHQVIALVRTPHPGLASEAQICVGDIAEVDSWSDAVAGADVLVHLAARVHVMRETADDARREYERVNTRPTLALARAANAANVRRFIFVSSIKVNGERTDGTPFTSDSRPSPVDPYGESKLAAELGLRALAKDAQMQVVILRPPVVYGPGVGGNIRRLATAVQSRLPLPFASIRNRRTMLAVGNLVQALVAATEGAVRVHAPQPILLGDLEPVSTRSLVGLLAEGVGVAPRLLPLPVPFLRFGAGLLGRAQDVDRLVQDLVIEPGWEDLGIAREALASPEVALPAVGRWVAEASGARAVGVG